MKFGQNNSTDVIKVGDIQSNSVSIDTNNIDFLITILSTNLYSNPIPSFIRETVSNAWDSHIEAGISEPVILELGKDEENNYFCRIQDFGVGLSEERFDKIYKNIGSSTKRSDNSQIGGFGIGRFSALAYSDTVSITSNYNGEQFKYLMYKDGNKLSIDLLHKQPTAERNGVEIRIPVKQNDLTAFTEAISNQLVYFENLFLLDTTDISEVSDFVEYFNSFQIKKYNNFIVNNLNEDRSRTIQLVLGKVKYPLRLQSLTKRYPTYISNYPIGLMFNIGDLEVTPNREEILYSSSNIAKIEAELDKALEEIQELINSQEGIDYNSISKYIKANEDTNYLTLLDNGGNYNNKEVRITLDKSNRKITYKGLELNWTALNYIKRTLDSFFITTYNYKLKSGKLVAEKLNSLNIHGISLNFPKIFIGDVGGLGVVTKAFIRDTFEEGSIFITPRDLKIYMRRYLRHILINKNGYDRKLILKYAKLVIREYLANILQLKDKVVNDKIVTQEYIKERKKKQKELRELTKGTGINWSENVNLKILREGRGSSYVATDARTYKLEDLRDRKYPFTKGYVVYGEPGNITLENLAIFKFYGGIKGNITFAEVAPTRMKLLENFSNFVNIKDIMNIVKYKFLRKIATAVLIEQDLPHLAKLAELNNLEHISLNLFNAVQELNAYVNKFSNLARSLTPDQKALVEEICMLCAENNYFDEDIRPLLDRYKEDINKASALILLAAPIGSYSKKMDIPEKSINLAIDYVLARRLFRPDSAAAIKMKKETVLKPLENENS